MNDSVKRGGLLNMFSGISFALYMLVVGEYLIDWDSMTISLPTWAALILPTITFVRPLSLLGIWLWSRWGLTVNIACTCVETLSFLALGFKMNYANLAITAILAVLVWPNWKYMDWKISAHPHSPPDSAQ